MRAILARAFVVLTLLSGAAALLSACHTVNGVGQDISSTAGAVHNATGVP